MQWDVLPRLIRCAYATVPVVLTPQPILTPELTILTLWDAFMVEVTALVPAERQQRVDNYLETIEVTPLTDGGRAIFFWQGEARSVVLAGDMNGWNLNAAAAFQRIASWQDTIGTTGDLLPGTTFLLTTYENFIARVESLGFLALSHLLPGLLSLGEETPESLWHTGLNTDPWHWKDRVAEEKCLAYGCILGGHKGFVTQRMYPIFYAAFQPTLSMPEHWANRGTHSHLCRRKS